MPTLRGRGGALGAAAGDKGGLTADRHGRQSRFLRAKTTTNEVGTIY